MTELKCSELGLVSIPVSDVSTWYVHIPLIATTFRLLSIVPLSGILTLTDNHHHIVCSTHVGDDACDKRPFSTWRATAWLLFLLPVGDAVVSSAYGGGGRIVVDCVIVLRRHGLVLARAGCIGLRLDLY